jgi:hypothetical protein
MVSGSGLCARVVVVDARHHMLGRLASILAKELLNGQRVVRLSSSASSSSSFFLFVCLMPCILHSAKFLVSDFRFSFMWLLIPGPAFFCEVVLASHSRFL